MLPLELLKVVFGALSRHDLDALMLANVSFRDIVFRDFATEPLRYFEALNIYERQSYTFVSTTGNEYTCEDNDVFSRLMRHSRVGRLAFSTIRLQSVLFDEALFNVLLPHRDAWRDAHIITPCKFTSPTPADRAFSELLFCRSFLVVANEEGHHARPFLPLPAVRDCTFIRVFCPPEPLFAEGILDWLSVDARSGKPKRLEVVDWQLYDGVEDLVERLKTDFLASMTARCYVVKITTDETACEGQEGRFVNEDASKVLNIRRGPYGTRHFVAVTVKPLDDEQ